MIRIFKESDLVDVTQIWLDTNIKAHDFIQKEYWINNLEIVKEAFLKAEMYVHEDDDTNQIDGFIGLLDNYIAGLFVQECSQSKGIGKQLLDYVKNIRTNLSLSVYKKNIRAVHFYQREQFQIRAENNDENVNEREITMIWEI
ncbi:MAG: GNAT family N-acetyltransferase [Methanocorpusculum sp.]|nr:GNAT family N-acetyltransferase [Methanocorpusculum sp.]